MVHDERDVETFCKMIENTPSFGSLPIWPYESEPPKEVYKALAKWQNKTLKFRILSWGLLAATILFLVIFSISAL